MVRGQRQTDFCQDKEEAVSSEGLTGLMTVSDDCATLSPWSDPRNTKVLAGQSSPFNGLGSVGCI